MTAQGPQAAACSSSPQTPVGKQARTPAAVRKALEVLKSYGADGPAPVQKHLESMENHLGQLVKHHLQKYPLDASYTLCVQAVVAHLVGQSQQAAQQAPSPDEGATGDVLPPAPVLPIVVVMAAADGELGRRLSQAMETHKLQADVRQYDLVAQPTGHPHSVVQAVTSSNRPPDLQEGAARAFTARHSFYTAHSAAAQLDAAAFCLKPGGMLTVSIHRHQVVPIGQVLLAFQRSGLWRRLEFHLYKLGPHDPLDNLQLTAQRTESSYQQLSWERCWVDLLHTTAGDRQGRDALSAQQALKGLKAQQDADVAAQRSSKDCASAGYASAVQALGELWLRAQPTLQHPTAAASLHNSATSDSATSCDSASSDSATSHLVLMVEAGANEALGQALAQGPPGLTTQQVTQGGQPLSSAKGVYIGATCNGRCVVGVGAGEQGLRKRVDRYYRGGVKRWPALAHESQTFAAATVQPQLSDSQVQQAVVNWVLEGAEALLTLRVGLPLPHSQAHASRYGSPHNGDTTTSGHLRAVAWAAYDAETATPAQVQQVEQDKKHLQLANQTKKEAHDAVKAGTATQVQKDIVRNVNNNTEALTRRSAIIAETFREAVKNNRATPQQEAYVAQQDKNLEKGRKGRKSKVLSIGQELHQQSTQQLAKKRAREKAQKRAAEQRARKRARLEQEEEERHWRGMITALHSVTLNFWSDGYDDDLDPLDWYNEDV